MQAWELEIRESVRQTLADYTAATDSFALEALAACFTADGVLQYPGGKPLTGPAAIEAGLGAQLGGPRDAARPAPTHVRHHVSSVRFSRVARDRVEVASYFAVYTDIGLDHWGRYRDVLVPHDGRWLFASRKITVDAFSANSLMGGSAPDELLGK
ncbi:nuclear transport factor 2 family protein [Mycobacterium kyorinense]|uniref:nuclear transport factor 2 family protein n=1 Tax=Mycobacterium kyorinense TaxID=487514 RepID=UPI00084C880E|nr:nuclear transport factor 2 family protein [Mycobacterium kyorinense]